MPRRQKTGFETCRLLYHAWDPVSAPPGWAGGMSRHVLHLRCLRCGTYRHDGFDVLGRLMTRQYVHPDGYRMARDDVPTRDELRLTMVRSRNGDRAAPS